MFIKKKYIYIYSNYFHYFYYMFHYIEMTGGDTRPYVQLHGIIIETTML